MGQASDEKQKNAVRKQGGKRNWLDLFWKFMMMGGFILVLFLIGGIVIAVSVLTRGCSAPSDTGGPDLGDSEKVRIACRRHTARACPESSEEQSKTRTTK